MISLLKSLLDADASINRIEASERANRLKKVKEDPYNGNWIPMSEEKSNVMLSADHKRITKVVEMVDEPTGNRRASQRELSFNILSAHDDRPEHYPTVHLIEYCKEKEVFWVRTSFERFCPALDWIDSEPVGACILLIGHDGLY